MKGFEPSVQWSSLGTQSVPSDKSYTPTGVTLMAAMAYNKNKVKSPKTIYPNEPGTCLRSRWDVTAGTALAGARRQPAQHPCGLSCLRPRAVVSSSAGT
jgi:hypothetical protein